MALENIFRTLFNRVIGRQLDKDNLSESFFGIRVIVPPSAPLTVNRFVKNVAEMHERVVLKDSRKPSKTPMLGLRTLGICLILNL